MDANPFHSTCLLYRAIESPEDDAFFHALQDDPLTFMSSTPSLAAPVSRRISSRIRETFEEKALLGVLICLPTTPENLALAGLDAEPPSSSTTNSAGDDKDKKNDNKTTFPSLVRPGLHDRGIPIGAMCLNPPHGAGAGAHHRSADVAIDIAPKYQNRGYGSEAIRWILEWGFMHAGLHRIGIRVLGWNEGALRLYQRLGFVLESRERQAWWSRGRWWDDLGLGMLEEEWKERYGGQCAMLGVGSLAEGTVS
ncbi:MAG: hypothetical protein LQ340_003264 [Diploschistes diacapsis]|nr:MAG: hypothetical protein LQ340_003264 [Diploschistes diacapsis]